MKYFFIVIFVLVGCGGGPDLNTHSDSRPPPGVGNRHRRAVNPPSLVNALTGIIQNLVHEGRVVATRIGEALPKEVEPIQLSGVVEKTETFEKLFESSVLKTDLVYLKYQIKYEYGGKWKGKGVYLANVSFSPVQVDVDPLWSLEAVAVSQKPTNRGTEKAPVAELKFGITFTIKGVGGTRGVTDEFVLNAETGELVATIRDFE